MDLREGNIVDGTGPHALPLGGNEQEHPAAAKAHAVERIAARAAVHAAHAASVKIETNDPIGIRDGEITSVGGERAAHGRRIPQKASVTQNVGRV